MPSESDKADLDLPLAYRSQLLVRRAEQLGISSQSAADRGNGFYPINRSNFASFVRFQPLIRLTAPPLHALGVPLLNPHRLSARLSGTLYLRYSHAPVFPTSPQPKNPWLPRPLPGSARIVHCLRTKVGYKFQVSARFSTSMGLLVFHGWQPDP